MSLNRGTRWAVVGRWAQRGRWAERREMARARSLRVAKPLTHKDFRSDLMCNGSHWRVLGRRIT